MRFIHQLSDWPRFYWDEDRVALFLTQIRYNQGRLLGHMESMGFPRQANTSLEALTKDVVQSSEIEGEHLDEQQVRSSIARRLGIDIAGLVPSDRDVEGVVEMMLDATQNFSKSLTKERLLGWHASLFPTGRSGMTKISVGKWRDESSGNMQVVSGPLGKERVHFEAPAADLVDKEMVTFIKWFNSKQPLDPVLKSAIAHLWFVTIHPFEDGNGRIARALSDMWLARSENSEQRYYSMSAEIRKKRDEYYRILEATQRSDTLDITVWLQWFLGCLDEAIKDANSLVADVRERARFWDAHKDVSFNERQRLILNKLLDNFKGKLTSSKWAKIAKCSQDTALRDINDLMRQGVLKKDQASGRSTSYSLRSD